jgi:hypothetical protein
MAWRKWTIRSLVFMTAAALAAGAVAYHHWTNPEAVRAKVLEELEKHLPGAHVALESAQWSLLGGITFTELRLTRRDDPGQTVLIEVPSGFIYPNKETLKKGILEIRKIVLDRPRILVNRREDQTINLSGILREPDIKFKVPIIELNKATMVFLDEANAAGLAALVAKDVHLSIINDPRPTLTFEGTGVSDLVGVIKVSGGKYGRASSEFAATLDLPLTPVTGDLIERLSRYCPEAGTHARQLSGTLAVHAAFRRGATEASWNYEAHAHLTHGGFAHAQLPFPLDELDVEASCLDGQVTVEKLVAKAGGAHIEAGGTSPSLEFEDLDGELKVDRLPATEAVLRMFPPGTRHVISEFDPHGACNLQVEFHRHHGQVREHCLVHPYGCDGSYVNFPYRVHRVSGTIEHQMDSARSFDFVRVDLIGYSGNQPVKISGTVEGRTSPALDLKIQAESIVIEDRLRAALPAEFHKLVSSFTPQGQVDVDARIRKTRNNPALDYRYLVRFRDCAMSYEVFPYPVESVAGILDIRADHWEFNDFKGRHKGADFQARGRSLRTPEGTEVRIQITGQNLPLDDELFVSLQHQGLQSTWAKLHPEGNIAFSADVFLSSRRKEPEIGVTVTPQGCSIKPDFFPYTLAGLVGTVVYREHGVTLSKLSGRHGTTAFQLEEGKILFAPEGSISVDLVRLMANPLVPDHELCSALPPQLGSVVTRLGLKDPVSLVTNLTIEIPPAATGGPPYLYWDGGLRVKDAALHVGTQLEHVNGIVWCRGKHHGTFGNVLGNLELSEATLFNQPLRDLRTQLVVDEKEPTVLKLPNFKARLFDGDLGGEIRVETGNTTRYAVNLTGSQIRLDQFGKHNDLGSKAQLQGLAALRIFLQGEGDELVGLRGDGSFDVENGKMYNLPLILDLLKFLNLRWPDRTAFEDAHIRFTIHGPDVEIGQLDLLGNAISLGGRGTMNLESKDIKMDLYAVMGRVVSLAVPPLKQLLPEISKGLLKIRMTGKIGGQLHFEKEILPVFQEPVRGLLQRIGS